MDIFESYNVKKTRQREKIIEIISTSIVYLNDIIENSLKYMNKSTVYRIIDLFLEKGVLVKKIDENNNIYFNINELEHTHYLNCNICHKKDKISKEYIKNFENDVLNQSDFYITSHNIEFRGICKDCKGKMKNE